MEMICGACGKKIELDVELTDGQHILCPFCGEKTEYRKPTRIQLPTGLAGAVRRQAPAPAEEPSDKPKLQVRKPVALSEDLNAKAIMRNMAEQEELSQQTLERQRAAKKKAAREVLTRNLLLGGLALLLLVAGAFCFLRWQDAQQRRRAEELVRYRQQQEEEARQDAAKRQRWEEEKAQREAERQERIKANEALREKRRAEAKEREAQQAADRKEKDAEWERRQAVRAHFAEAERRFYGAELHAWRALPVNKRPGAVAGVFLCLFPHGNGECEIYEVVSRTDGIERVNVLTPDAEPREVTFEACQERIATLGSIVYDGTRVFVIPPKMSAKFAFGSEDVLNPSELRLVELYGLIDRHDMETKALVFQTDIQCQGNSIGVLQLGYGQCITLADVRSKVEARAQQLVPKRKSSKMKRRVMLYDGRVIKKQMNGVTLVPRNPIRVDQQWNELYEEANRQDQLEADAARASESDWRAKVNAQIEKMLGSATLVISITER